jgi:hypothetical protein
MLDAFHALRLPSIFVGFLDRIGSAYAYRWCSYSELLDWTKCYSSPLTALAGTSFDDMDGTGRNNASYVLLQMRG